MLRKRLLWRVELHIPKLAQARKRKHDDHCQGATALGPCQDTFIPAAELQLCFSLWQRLDMITGQYTICICVPTADLLLTCWH